MHLRLQYIQMTHNQSAIVEFLQVKFDRYLNETCMQVGELDPRLKETYLMEFEFNVIYESHQWITQDEVRRRKAKLEEWFLKLASPQTRCKASKMNSFVRIIVLHWFNLDQLDNESCIKENSDS